VPDDPGEVQNVPQERRDVCREKKTGDNTMKLLTWNACRLLAGGRELALVNLLTSTGADVATITECKIPEGSGEFSVAGYTTFSPSPSLQGGKTRVLILVKNDLAVRANVKVIKDIIDPAVQSVWLQFSHHRIGGSTLGAFILGGIYREWTPQLSQEESKLRLEALLHQISNAADGSRVIIHGDFNVDLDRVDDGTYYMATHARSLAECTTTAGLEAHVTLPTFLSYGNFVPHPVGDISRPPGDVACPAGGGPRPAGGSPSPAGGRQSPAGGSPSPAGDYHKYARLDHVYSKGLVSESRVTPDATTDHRPVVTTVRAGGRCPGTIKFVSLKRQNFKAITREELEGTLKLTDWSGVYAMRDVDDILNFIKAGIVSALNIIAPEKVIRVKKGQNL
jgi:exonuclease III